MHFISLCFLFTCFLKYFMGKYFTYHKIHPFPLTHFTWLLVTILSGATLHINQFKNNLFFYPLRSHMLIYCKSPLLSENPRPDAHIRVKAMTMAFGKKRAIYLLLRLPAGDRKHRSNLSSWSGVWTSFKG